MSVRPIVCMISDRHRLGIGWQDSLVERVQVAARRGVHLIQVRERDVDARTLLRVVGRCVEAVRGTPARVVVNDRVDVALAAGAHGVHLRGDSCPAPRVRQLVGARWLVGRSVHSLEEAAEVEAQGGVDYLIFGTVFASRSKVGLPGVGAEALAAVARGTRVPVLAVGGVTDRTAGAVAGAGAAGVAAIGLFLDPPVDALADVVARVTASFCAAHPQQ